MDPFFYKVLHLVGLMAVFMGLGVTLVPDSKARKYGLLLHGTGLGLVLVAGFGLIATMKTGFPSWVILKMVIWLALGLVPMLVKRRAIPPAVAWMAALALGFGAAYLGIYKQPS